MKKQIIIPAALLFFALTSCGPAAENREQMHARAKTIADSMANLIKTAMAEAEMPVRQPVVSPPKDTSANKTNTVAPPKK
jgi:hypothetical protein